MELSPQAFEAEFTKGKLRPAYLLLGEDSAAKVAAVAALKASPEGSAADWAEFAGDDDAQAAELVSTCLTAPMFCSRRIVLVRNAKFGAAARRALAEYLRAPSETATLLLVSEERKADPKDALAAGAAAAGAVVLFKPLSERDALGRLADEARRAGFELAPDAARLLVEEAGSEWGILKGELDKLALFMRGRRKAGVQEVSACLGYRHEANPFDLPRLLESRDAVRTLELLRRMLREDGDPYGLLYKLTQSVNRQLKAKRMLKAGASPDQVFGSLRLQKWYDRDYLTVLSRISEASLIRALWACLETEVALKSQTWLDPQTELETLVARICAKAPTKR